MTTPRSGEPLLGSPFSLAGTATAVLDRRGVVIGWNAAAQELLGHAPGDALGRAARQVFVPLDGRPLFGPDSPVDSWGETRSLRSRDGAPVRVVVYVLPLAPGPGGTADADGTAADAPARWAVVAIAAERMERWATDQAMLSGLFSQTPIGFSVYGPDGRLSWVNPATEVEYGAARELWFGRLPSEVLPEGEIISPEARGRPLEEVVERVFRTGKPVLDVHYRSALPADPGRPRVWSCSYFRLQDQTGRLLGVCEAAFDITERYEAQHRLELLSRSSSIGTSLDAVRTVEELIEVAVPELADAAWVDLAEAALTGADTAGWTGTEQCRRVADSRTGRAAGGLAGSVGPGGSGGSGDSGGSASGTGTGAAAGAAGLVDLPADDRQLVLPLATGDATLGLVTLLRTAPRRPFADADRSLAAELVSRTAVCVDNARRYAHQSATALLLQHHLLPQDLPQPTAVETAHHYAPGAGPMGVGGDWYDVIPLSGARVGLVVGDVVGHGLHAAVTMGRLRTTVRALAALDLAPDELLSRLDDLVGQARIDLDPTAADPGGDADQALCARCLYVVYDPVAGRCAAASAGHLPPVLVVPGGAAAPVDMPVGLPLGVGGLPFESAEFETPERSTLALFTDGLVTDGLMTDGLVAGGLVAGGGIGVGGGGADQAGAVAGAAARAVPHAGWADPDAGLAELCRIMTEHRGSGLSELRRRIIQSGPAADAPDDAALLLARVHALGVDNVASWGVGPDTAEVAGARAHATEQLGRWGLGAVDFAVELIVSELVTNAIRYGRQPVRLRLLRDGERALICEVSDGRETSPHLRRARLDEEGGRGLFLVAQLAEQWGTRFTREGKTIWAEIPIPHAAAGIEAGIEAGNGGGEDAGVAGAGAAAAGVAAISAGLSA